MKRLWLVVALFALVIPAAAQAKGGGELKQAATRHCKALRAEMGAEAFGAAFGGKHAKHALKRCVKAQRKVNKAARKRARAACRADGVRGPALKRCVRERMGADTAASPESFKNAVDVCRAQQADDPEAFAEEFGDGPNAFGKCVAEAADDHADDPEGEDSADGDDPVEDEPADEGETLDGSPEPV